MNNAINKIGEIEFRDVKVGVYYDPLSKKDDVICSWSARNPNTYYEGIIYRNDETGEITYPEGVEVPIQSKEDREQLPKFLVVGIELITDELKTSIEKYFEKEYCVRNKMPTK